MDVRMLSARERKKERKKEAAEKMLGAPKFALYGLVLLVAGFNVLHMVNGDRVYLSASGSPAWDGVCGGCSEAAPCGISGDAYNIASDCELVLLPDYPTSKPIFTMTGTGWLNVSSLGVNVTTSVDFHFRAVVGHIFFHELALVLENNADFLIDSQDWTIVDSSLERSNKAGSIILVQNGAPQIKSYVRDTVMISPLKPSSGSYPLIDAVFVDTFEVTLERVIVQTPGDLIQSTSSNNGHWKISIIDSDIHGSFCRAYLENIPGDVLIQNTRWMNAPSGRFITYGVTRSLTILDSILDNPIENDNGPWASAPSSSDLFKVVNSSFSNLPVSGTASMLIIEDSIITHQYADPIFQGRYDNASISNVRFEREGQKTPFAEVLYLRALTSILDISLDNVIIRETTPYSDGGLVKLPSSVRFFASDLYLPLPSLTMVESTFNASRGVVHFTGDLKSDKFEGASNLQLVGNTFIFDSIKAYDVSFNVKHDTHVIYHVTNMEAGCIESNSASSGGGPFLFNIESSILLIDLSDQDIHSQDKLPSLRQEYPLFLTSQSDLNVTDVSGHFKLSYSLKSDNRGTFSFGEVPCNPQCVSEHTVTPCVHTTLCQCLTGWAGPTCNQPSSDISPSEPTSQSSPTRFSSPSWTLALILFVVVYSLLGPSPDSITCCI